MEQARTRIAAMRREYSTQGIDVADLGADPIAAFGEWFAAATESGIVEPNAMALATATPDARPSVRVVLLKDFDERGFTFYTNYTSRKGGELDANPRAAMTMLWQDIQRQVRVEGAVQRVTEAESAAYFASRPPDARISAWASPQSQVLRDRADLEERLVAVTEEYGDDPPLPPFWGGYRIVPEVIEFWQGRRDRRHDRVRFRRHGDGWVVDRLAP